MLQEIVAQRRGATMQALCAEFSQRTGLAVCTVTLRRALVRAGLECIKARQPSAAVVDAQSTRNSPQGGGFDGGKKGKGRKRHVAVDTLGVLLAVSVTAASVQDRDGAPAALVRACAAAPSIQPLFPDSACAGQCAHGLRAFHGIKVEIVRRHGAGGHWDCPQMSLWPPPVSGFVVLPKRWVVERSHAWGQRCRRLVMHHDRSPRLAEART